MKRSCYAGTCVIIDLDKSLNNLDRRLIILGIKNREQCEE